MSARTSTLKRPRNLSPTATLNVMNSNSNSGMNSNTNADNRSPLAKRLKTIREVKTQPTPSLRSVNAPPGNNTPFGPNKSKVRFNIPLRTAAMGAANNIRMKAKANVNVSSAPRVNNQPSTVRRSTRIKIAKGKPSIGTIPMKRRQETSSVKNNAKLLMNVSRQAAAVNGLVKAGRQRNANSNAGITPPPAKRAKTIRKANTQPTPRFNTTLRTAPMGAAKTSPKVATIKAKASPKVATNNAKASPKVATIKAVANVKTKPTTPANSARVSATTLGSPNQSTNNNADSTQASFIQPANKRKDAKPGKLMKEGILLYITKRAQRTAGMKGLNNLGKLNKSLRNPNSIKEYDTYAWALLYDMVKALPDTKFEENGEQLKVSPKTLKQIHEKLRQKNVYSSGRTTGGEGNRRVFTETFNSDEIVEFMLLIWLDGSHDGYITSSFLEWLDSPTCKEYFSNRHRDLAKSFVEKFPNPTKYTKTFKKKPTEFKNFKTELFKNITGYDTIRKICIETEAIWFFIHEFNPGTSKQMIDKVFKKDKKTSLSTHFERELKLGIKEILNTRQTNEIYSGGAINDLKKTGVKIVSLDMEADGDILSEVIKSTPSFRPYITVANLIDPGKHMIKTSAGSKDVQLVLSVMQTGNVELLNNLKCQYYIGPLNFTIMDNFKTKNGKNNSLPFFKINLSITPGGPSITNEGRAPTLDFFDLKVNGKKVLQGATGAQARNGPSKPRATNFVIRTPEAKMGKFMGDALQYMVVAIQNKYRGRERYFASGDGSACFMYVYFCNKLNIKPRLIIDKGDERIRTVGLRNNDV